MQDNDSFAGGTYPSPDELPERTVTITINVTYELEDTFPEAIEDDEIIDYVKGEFRFLDFDKTTIEDIEVC